MTKLVAIYRGANPKLIIAIKIILTMKPTEKISCDRYLKPQYQILTPSRF